MANFFVPQVFKKIGGVLMSTETKPEAKPEEKLFFHSMKEQDIFSKLQTNATGLTSKEAAKRLEEHGPNKLEEGKRKTLLQIFIAQFGDLMIWILMAAAVISAVVGEPVDAAIIGIVVVLNSILGTVQESKAEAALDALKQMAAPIAKVLRDGSITKVDASQIVVGDVVVFEAGDSIPADIRLIQCASLKVEESALTGESVPVEKQLIIIDDTKAALGDRVNMSYMGTAATYGRGTGIVIATGMNTEMGSIARQLASTEKETTPLQKQLNGISNILSIGVLIIATVIFGIGMLSGREPFEMFLTAISLAVAAIPEGLVAVVTIVLAMGMSRMAGNGAIIRRLPAVETLGSTQVICSDKTGTLTQNRMTVQKAYSQNEATLFEAMRYCNDSKLDANNKAVGDPTETALIDYLIKDKKYTVDEIKNSPRDGEIPFDSERKLSSVALKNSGGFRIYVKGAPDVLLARCIKELSGDKVVELGKARQDEIVLENENMAKLALRVLAFGFKDVTALTPNDVVGTESGLTFCGLIGMIDPARPEAKDAIAVCRKAGILPVMITGDHKITAVAIANDLGILDDGREAINGAELQEMTDEELSNRVEKIGVYARVSPEHKTRIVAAWQKKHKIVAMTGDGVNDAPALKASDIGVGMGITGTDVSKGASDVVLTDDNFATIVKAVAEGRRIFDNIHKTVRFLLSSNAGEVIAILFATLMGWKFLLPIHILWINLVTDTFPALALGVEPPEKGAMARKPRDSRLPFFTKSEWIQVLVTGTMEAALAIFAYLLGGQGMLGTTMAFLVLSLSQLFAAVALQSERTSIFKNKAKDHPMLWLAFFGSTMLQLSVVLIPPLRDIFKLAQLDLASWVEVIGLCFVMLIFVEVQKLFAKKEA